MRFLVHLRRCTFLVVSPGLLKTRNHHQSRLYQRALILYRFQKSNDREAAKAASNCLIDQVIDVTHPVSQHNMIPQILWDDITRLIQ